MQRLRLRWQNNVSFIFLHSTDTLPSCVSIDTFLVHHFSSLLSVLLCLRRHISGVGLHWYLFVFSIDVNFLRADGLADVVDVVLSAVIEDVLILFPESGGEKKRTKRQNVNGFFLLGIICTFFVYYKSKI